MKRHVTIKLVALIVVLALGLWYGTVLLRQNTTQVTLVDLEGSRAALGEAEVAGSLSDGAFTQHFRLTAQGSENRFDTLERQGTQEQQDWSGSYGSEYYNWVSIGYLPEGEMTQIETTTLESGSLYATGRAAAVRVALYSGSVSVATDLVLQAGEGKYFLFTAYYTPYAEQSDAQTDVAWVAEGLYREDGGVISYWDENSITTTSCMGQDGTRYLAFSPCAEWGQEHTMIYRVDREEDYQAWLKRVEPDLEIFAGVPGRSGRQGRGSTSLVADLPISNGVVLGADQTDQGLAVLTYHNDRLEAWCLLDGQVTDRRELGKLDLAAVQQSDGDANFSCSSCIKQQPGDASFVLCCEEELYTGQSNRQISLAVALRCSEGRFETARIAGLATDSESFFSGNGIAWDERTGWSFLHCQMNKAGDLITVEQQSQGSYGRTAQQSNVNDHDTGPSYFAYQSFGGPCTLTVRRTTAPVYRGELQSDRLEDARTYGTYGSVENWVRVFSFRTHELDANENYYWIPSMPAQAGEAQAQWLPLSGKEGTV